MKMVKKLLKAVKERRLLKAVKVRIQRFSRIKKRKVAVRKMRLEPISNTLNSYVSLMRKYNKDYFEGKTSNWERGYIRDALYPTILKLQTHIRMRNPSARKVLCLGCAKGYEVEMWSDFDTFAVGVDVSNFALRNTDVKEQLILADARLLPFKDNTFDLAVASELLEHIPEPYLDMVLSEIRRVSSTCTATMPMVESKGLGDLDTGHVTIKPQPWWSKKLGQFFKKVEYWEYFIWKGVDCSNSH